MPEPGNLFLIHVRRPQRIEALFQLQNTIARPIAGVSFGPKGSLVAGGSGGYDVWDLAASTHTFIPSHAVKYYYGCVCDPLGRWIYVADSLGGFRLLPLDGGEARPTPGSPHERHVTTFDVTSDGRQLVMNRGGGGSNRVECWKIRPKGAFAAVWSIRDGNLVDPDEPFYLNQATWFTNAVATSRDGKVVATAESRQTAGAPLLVLRNAASGEVAAEPGELATSFVRLAFSPDGKAVYAWDDNGLERWDVKSAKRTHRVAAPGRAYFKGIATTLTGRLVVTVSGDGQARYWHPVDLSPIRSIKCGVGKLHSLAISPNGAQAAAGGDKGRIAIWDIED
jgi:WD40 repeat protein